MFRRWKAWIVFGPTRLAFELEGEFTFVTETATMLAERLGGTFNYEIEEVK
jgi:hypothetical protein